MALKENKIPSQEDLKSQPTKFTDEELNKIITKFKEENSLLTQQWVMEPKKKGTGYFEGP